MPVKKKALKKKPVKKSTLKKKPVKKAAKKTVKKARKPAKLAKNVIGIVTHYFPHVQVAVVKLKAPLAAGDTIKIKGHTTDFTQAVTSMQMDHAPITTAKKGQEIGLQVESRVRRHDLVTKP